MSEERIVHRACHLCEAICGLEIRVEGDRIASIRGDAADPFSRGHLCPKGVALIDVHHDPDRLRTPVVRRGDRFEPIGWDDAIGLVATNIAAIQRAHGANALGLYLGNPNAHHIGSLLHAPSLIRALGTRNRFSASSVDQLPHHVVAHAMYGHQFLIPIPDLDRTDYWLILGGNPLASNGSLMTAPDVARRLRAIRERGAVVVIDPVRTETAAAASRHHFIRPGTDVLFLLALVNALVELGPPRVGAYPLANLDEALAAIREFGFPLAPTGIDESTVRKIARELHDARAAVAYGRIGVSTQRYGTLCHWLIQLVNLLTGNLDREGGALVTTPAIPMTGPGTRPGGFGKSRTRVASRPIFGGELPSAAMAEEIETPGEGQIRAMLTIAGNPVASTPDGKRLARAFASLEFMAAIDVYVNETTRHAHVILPPASALEHENYDLVFNAFAIRNVARYNPPVFEKTADARWDWQIYDALAAAHARELGAEHKPFLPPAAMLDHGLRHGPCATSLRELAAHPHGRDLGPLVPSLVERLETPDRRIDCAPAAILADLPRVRELFADDDDALKLVGRRHLRSNNSWMHNAHRLVKGPRRDHLWIHPDDASARGVADLSEVRLASRTGEIVVTARVTDAVMRGTVCLPHGFGQGRDGVRLSIAKDVLGASYNDVSDPDATDPVSGNAALSGLAVRVEAV